MTAHSACPIGQLPRPSKEALTAAFVGKPISSLRTPAIILDRARFKRHCLSMTAACREKGVEFRAHVKTHKTAEGVRLQLEGNKNGAVVCSTLMECWQLLGHGLVSEGVVKDILYGLPAGVNKMEELAELAGELEGHGAVLRLMIDHPGQVEALAEHPLATGKPWSIFIKVDGGGRRAGLPADSAEMRNLISTALQASHVDIYGFYSHFGQSYGSNGTAEAATYLDGEVECAATAAQLALNLGAKPRNPYVLSVGATPTAHAIARLKDSKLPGRLELHAGNYCCLDLQQLATGLVHRDDVAVSVLTHVVSDYPSRGETLCDAGALAMSRDTGRLPGYGQVVWPERARGWELGRTSQEHGMLTEGSEDCQALQLGDCLRIVGQHACLTLAGHPWYYCVDNGGEIVTDVWVPWKGW